MVPVFLVSIIGCEGRQFADPESQAKYALEEIEKEFRSREQELKEALNLGELTSDDVDEFERETRLRLEEFVREHKGTDAAAGVILEFVVIDMSRGEFASAEARLDEIIALYDKGDYLATALVQKSIIEADRDLESAMAYIIRAENIEGVDQRVKFEAEVQHLRLLEWLRRDVEFEALYIKLSEMRSGRNISHLVLCRLNYFLRHKNREAAQGLIDSVQGGVPEDIMNMLKAEYASEELVGNPAPVISGTSVMGADLDLNSLESKVVLIIFFTSPNPEIKRHLPRLNRMYEEFHDAGLEMVGISLDVTEDVIVPFMSANDIAWPVISDNDSQHQLAYRVYRDPKYYIIDREGNVASQGLEGVLLEEKIREMLESESDN